MAIDLGTYRALSPSQSPNLQQPLRPRSRHLHGKQTHRSLTLDEHLHSLYFQRGSEFDSYVFSLLLFSNI